MIRRRVVRAVMLTPDRHVLLMRVQEPVSGIEFWVTPGGGLEPGESDEDALRREVAEETGATRFSVDRLVLTRRVEFTWDHRDYSQREYFYRVQTDRFEPIMDGNPAQGEASAFREFRWWSIDDIGSSEETFSPRDLYSLLESLTRNGPPWRPVDVVQ
ncbi:MAG: NUDIX domain-containing protein [Gemmatimonadota bacterium]|nr:NUDIX domain-containing protein [Gemmatimonadota bacterium]